MKTTIYHNPRCSKSRQTLALLENKTDEITIVKYLKDVPSESEIKEVLSLLNVPAENIIRKGEVIYKEKYKGKKLTENEWVKAMIEHPKLMERPIVIKDGKAILGRPPENVLELF